MQLVRNCLFTRHLMTITTCLCKTDFAWPDRMIYDGDGKWVCNQDEHGITHMFARQIDCKMLVWNFNSIDLCPCVCLSTSTQMAKLHVRAYKIGFSWQFQFHVGHKVHCAAVRGGQARGGQVHLAFINK